MEFRPVLLVLVLTGCKPSASEMIMDKIESSVRMPQGAEALTRYRRYYCRDGQAVVGTYVLSSKPGREWREKNKMMLVLDGGCGVVNIIFSTKESRVTYTDCNGVA
jgi:hypothetical protein